MPSNSAKVKIRAVESYGAQVVFCEPAEESREIKCAEVINQTGATLIHSFENEHVVAGQGTAAMELLEDITDLDVIMCPVGGGGLLSGTAIAAKSMRPQIKVIAVEPENADDAAQSFRAGRRLVTEKKFTIADGLRTNIGEPNFAIIQQYVDDIVTVSEEAIVSAMRTIWETMKIVIEPSAAVPYAAIQEGKSVVDKRIGIILTGGNVDLDALPWNCSRDRDPRAGINGAGYKNLSCVREPQLSPKSKRIGMKTLSAIIAAFILVFGAVASRGANLDRISAATGVPVATLQGERRLDRAWLGFAGERAPAGQC